MQKLVRNPVLVSNLVTVYTENYSSKGTLISIIKNARRSVSSCDAQSQNLRKLFPKREEFQSRHIGPRDHDIIAMLDLVGYKVRVPEFYRKLLLIKVLCFLSHWMSLQIKQYLIESK